MTDWKGTGTKKRLISWLFPCAMFFSMAEEGVRVLSGQLNVNSISDERVDFVREQVFTALRLKTDKWNRFIGSEENQKSLLDFLDNGLRERLVMFTGPGGTLHIGDGQVNIALNYKPLTLILKHVLLSKMPKENKSTLHLAYV